MKAYSEIRAKIAELEAESVTLFSEEMIAILDTVAGAHEEDVMTADAFTGYLAKLDEVFKGEDTPDLDKAMIEASKFIFG
jgi:hypothetical protein